MILVWSLFFEVNTEIFADDDKKHTLDLLQNKKGTWDREDSEWDSGWNKICYELLVEARWCDDYRHHQIMTSRINSLKKYEEKNIEEKRNVLIFSKFTNMLQGSWVICKGSKPWLWFQKYSLFSFLTVRPINYNWELHKKFEFQLNI